MARTMSTRERALGLLAMRAHGTAELKKKLLDKGCPADEVAETVERLSETGLLDDEALVAHEVERLQSGGHGPRSIHHKLARRGLDRDLVVRALDDLSEDSPFEDACLRALQKRFGSRRDAWDLKMKQKAMRFLAGRGYSQDQARKALSRFETDDE